MLETPYLFFRKEKKKTKWLAVWKGREGKGKEGKGREVVGSRRFFFLKKRKKPKNLNMDIG